MMDPVLYKLNNGIRLVHIPTSGIVAHCGLIINAGSRDESGHEHGIAHFIEHMLFKGTKKRKAWYILSRLEDVGGELNAYTTKEETVVHASFLKDDYARAVELIRDICFNSVFPEKEMEKEKDVILEEINSYRDNPAELIFDEFEEQILPEQPVGRNILGTPGSVRSFTRAKISDFISRNYNTSGMVFCSAGNIPENKIIKLMEKYFGDIDGSEQKNGQSLSMIYRPSSVTKKMNTYQNHCMIGNLAYHIRDKRRMAMFMLNNILGGQGLNSRLNISLREKNGLAYNVESNYNPYRDTGTFSIYFGTDSQYFNRSMSITMSELKKLRTVKLGSIQLSRAKSQVNGYLARGFENHENLMLSQGKNLLVFDRIDFFEEIRRKIENISASQIMETANEIFDPSKLSVLIYR
jgi:predicted Zn-dependent peptidase